MSKANIHLLVPREGLVTPTGSQSLHVDEWVEWLEEFSRNVVGGRRRIQRITVRRGEYWCDFEKDMGPAENFRPNPLFMVLGSAYRVGEAMDMAERLREDKAPEETKSTLAEDYLRERDEARQLRKHRTVSGPSLTIQR